MDPEEMAGSFGERFQELPRHLPDNSVEYLLFVNDGQLDGRRLLSELDDVRQAAMRLCERLTNGYIWQRDVFQLQIKTEDGQTFLHGTTDYGDSIEDEWLIVFILRELSASFSSLWVRIFDSDGEFLLVEAANVLPPWLTPEIDVGRVWIHRTNLRIIPLSATGGQKRPLSMAEAVSFIKSSPDEPLQSNLIESEAFYRLEKYPGKIQDSLHNSLITIPRKLAHILHQKSAVIAPAVEAFYVRTPASMKPLANQAATLHFPPKDLVTVSVRFSKVLFAQLKSQRFATPHVWTSVLETSEAQLSNDEVSARQHERLETGMKVTSAFEMLASHADKQDNRLAREFTILLEDVEEDGDLALPSDDTIEQWPDARRDDDESWLSIDFEEFEKELQGQHGAGERTANSGFGDAATQADLRKIVSRFEAFLNDNNAGPEGAELDDMDEDDDYDDDIDSDDEDKDVSFDEEHFSQMMREMMGFPAAPDSTKNRETKTDPQAKTYAPRDEGEGISDEEGILELAAQMEAELKGHGALKLDSRPKGGKALMATEATKSGTGAEGNAALKNDGEEAAERSDEEVDIDYNLAKNLMESFKSQAGMAGPVGNMLGMMGIQLPRDEDDETGSGEILQHPSK